MRKKNIFRPAATVLFILALALSLQAEDKFYGNFLFGFRFVDTSGPGAGYKYREDINLRGGARLADFSLIYSPDNGFRKYFDRLDMQVSNFGGDPFEAFRVSLQKYGKYMMQYSRKKSAYFYQDLRQGFGGSLYDLHSFDFDRVADSGLAKIFLSKKANLYLNFDRYTREGLSITTRDIERVEYELDRPIAEDSKNIAVGLNVHINNYSFVLEEKYLDYQNENSLFLPGYADGGPDAEYPSSLNTYVLDQPYDIKAYTHTLRFNGRPFSRLLLAGSALLMQADMDLSTSERADGTNTLGRRFGYSHLGTGKFDRDIQLYELDITYLMFRRLSLVAGIRYQKFDQSGSLTISNETESADIGFDTFGLDAGLQYLFSPRLTLTLGCRNETRQLDNLETATYEFETRRQGFFGNLKWDWRALKLMFDYQHSGYEEPYSLMSPVDFNRLRLTARYQAGRFSLTGSYLMNDTHSEVFEQAWDSTRNQLGLRFGFHADRLQAFAGYSYIAVKHEAERTVTHPPSWSGPGGTFLWDILYEGNSSLFDASLSYNLNGHWKLGGYANFYANRGSWEIDRTMLKAFLEYTFKTGYVVQFGYRFVDFNEKNSGFNDYQANIFELSFGYRWK